MFDKLKKYFNDLKPTAFMYLCITLILIICVLYNIKEILGVLL